MKRDAARNAYYIQHRARLLEKMREYRLKHNFGLSVADYDAILLKQNGVCAICGKPPRSHRLAVDHDHATNRIRGLLCHGCNYYVVAVYDRMPEFIDKVTAYLKN